MKVVGSAEVLFGHHGMTQSDFGARKITQPMVIVCGTCKSPAPPSEHELSLGCAGNVRLNLASMTRMMTDALQIQNLQTTAC